MLCPGGEDGDGCEEGLHGSVSLGSAAIGERKTPMNGAYFVPIENLRRAGSLWLRWEHAIGGKSRQTVRMGRNPKGSYLPLKLGSRGLLSVP